MDLITIIFIIVFSIPIIQGILYKFSSNSIKRDIEGLTGSIAFLISLFIGLYYAKLIFIQHTGVGYSLIDKYLGVAFFDYLDKTPQIIYFIIMPIFVFIFYRIIVFIFDFLDSLALYPIVDKMERAISKKSEAIKRLFGVIFSLPRSICYVIALAFILNIFSIFNVNMELNKALEASTVYKTLSNQIVIPIRNSQFAKQLPKIIDNSFRIVPKGDASTQASNGENTKGVIVYYNGVTLDQGIKSNSAIDAYAKKLCQNETTEQGKAKTLYNWVGSNISYDYDKADRVFQNDTNIASGAIPAFETRKGICFDYSCLYVAMSRAVGIKVRLITGEGYNGSSWVGHAWNQIFLTGQNSWINVDTTFYHGGNYFDSKQFNIDHRNSDIAGEW